LPQLLLLLVLLLRTGEYSMLVMHLPTLVQVEPQVLVKVLHYHTLSILMCSCRHCDQEIDTVGQEWTLEVMLVFDL
jgi:hypothetical protein